MDPVLLRVVLVVALVAVATLAGVLLQRRNGRTRVLAPASRAAAGAGDVAPSDPDGVATPSPDLVTLTSLGLSAPATPGPVVVQVSAAVCSPCRAAARTWRGTLPPERHLELDVEQRVDVARRLDVWRTPTSFVFSPDGVLHSRVDGVPTPAQARAALAGATPSGTPVQSSPSTPTRSVS